MAARRGAFARELAERAAGVGSWLCVGLDPVREELPPGVGLGEFCAGLVDVAARHGAAVKPNAAFFEALGRDGHEALAEACGLARRRGLVVVLDGKRNDIGPTARRYAEAAFDVLRAHAVTVTPYLGRDTVEPFAAYAERGVFLLARTSNPSAVDFQDLEVAPGLPLYQVVARKAMAWNAEWGNVGLVAGATYPLELAALRQLCGDGVPMLIPGVGAQGADAAATLATGSDSSGRFALVNVGRAILGAARGPGDWREAVESAAQGYARQLAPKVR